MRITIRLEDALLAKAKEVATEQNSTLARTMPRN